MYTVHAPSCCSGVHCSSPHRHVPFVLCTLVSANQCYPMLKPVAHPSSNPEALAAALTKAPAVGVGSKTF